MDLAINNLVESNKIPLHEGVYTVCDTFGCGTIIYSALVLSKSFMISEWIKIENLANFEKYG